VELSGGVDRFRLPRTVVHFDHDRAARRVAQVVEFLRTTMRPHGLDVTIDGAYHYRRSGTPDDADGRGAGSSPCWQTHRRGRRCPRASGLVRGETRRRREVLVSLTVQRRGRRPYDTFRAGNCGRGAARRDRRSHHASIPWP
jgi:hypothetical protein